MHGRWSSLLGPSSSQPPSLSFSLSIGHSSFKIKSLKEREKPEPGKERDDSIFPAWIHSPLAAVAWAGQPGWNQLCHLGCEWGTEDFTRHATTAIEAAQSE